MKSSRQKKRVSQQKKRHHEHVKAKGDSTGTTLAGKHVKGKEDSAGTSPSASRQEGEKLSSSKDQLDAPEKVISFLASRIITYIFVIYKGSRQQSFQNTKRS